MIKRILLIIILLGPMLSYSQKTYVPDDIFEAWLEGNGYGDSIPYNDSVLTSSISVITQLDLDNKNISDLTGISDMLLLRYLYAGNNTISTVDLTGLFHLEEINLGDNNLTQIVLPDSVYENRWGCSYSIENEYWAQYCGLNIQLYNNLLTSVIIPADLKVSNLNLAQNPLDYLDIQGYGMHSIDISNSNLTSVDLSNQNYLRQVWMYDNDSLLSLDLKNKIDLEYIEVTNHDLLNNFDLRNINLVNLNYHYFYNNPQLSCISVDNLTIANTLLDQIDSWCTFSLNCTGLGCTDSLALNYDIAATTDDGSCIYCVYGCMDSIAPNYDPLATCDDGSCSSPTVYGCTNSLALNYNSNATFDNGSCTYIKTYVPDDIFEAWLEGNGYGDGIAFNDSVLTSSISVITQLDLDNKNISDLTGISDMLLLRYLYAGNNTISTVDLTGLFHLEEINLGDNNLTQIVLPDSVYENRWGCSYSIENEYWAQYCGLNIQLYNNLLTSVIIPADLKVSNLNLAQNPLDYLDIQGYGMHSIDISNSNLTSVDLSNQNYLRQVWMYDNDSLLSLDLKNKIDLEYIEVTNHDLLNNFDLRNINLINLNYHYFYNNPQLSCISVDNLTIANTLLDQIDSWCTFSLNCTGLGCTDSLALNYDIAATTDDGSCIYCVYGCMDSIAPNYDPLATCDDGSCSSPTVYGCTNSLALNYNSNATFDNGSCTYIKTYVPDDIFEAWLEGNGYGDGIAFNDSVLTSSISVITQLDLDNKNISDLTGISDMLLLRYLYAGNNTISTVDLTGLFHLEEINLGDNNLTQIVLPDSVYENRWGCSYSIENEYWAQYCGLNIQLYNNLLTSVIIPADLKVSNLNLAQNPLDYLDIQGYGMHSIDISNSNLTSVDLSNQNYLRQVWMYDNDSLLSLDLKNKIDLEYIEVTNHDLLNNFDLRNINLVNLNYHYFYNNPQLSCISVSDTLVANILLDQIDPWCTFSLNCTGLGCMDPNALNYDPNVVTDDGSCIYQSLTYVPDDNFETFLETLGWGDGIALNDSVVTSSLVFVTSLDVSGLSISDLTGIEAFNALKNLYCQNNNLTSFDLSSNSNLEILNCNNNQLTALDVDSNTALTQIVCSSNPNIFNLDFANNPALNYLRCESTSISSLDLSNNTNLTYLYVDDNHLTNLDLSNNLLLNRLAFSYNDVDSLDLSNHSSIIEIYCPNNLLSYMDVKNGNSNNISIFNTLNNPNLTCINVDDTTYSNTNWTNIDPQSYFSNYCNSSLGCTDSNACNYDPSATTDDGSCIIGNCVENITQNTFTADIQSGINSALSGDTLVAYQGTYFENIYIDKRIILSSEYIFNNDTSYISSTIIDGSQDSTVVHIDTANVILKGFTVTNGYSDYGAGITAHGNGIVLTDLNVINNLAQGDLDGGGAAISGDVHILNSKFVNNQGRKGGAILMSWGSPLIENCQFSNNNCTESGAVFQIMSSTPTIINALITNNGDIGSLNNMNLIYTQGNTADAVFINSTITANSTLGYIALTHSGAISFLNSILYNDGFNEAGDYSGSFPSSISFSNCNVQGIALTNGNIDSSPLLNNDFTLSDNSACIGAGLDSSIVPLLDLNGAPRPNPIGSSPDIGAYENLLGTPFSDSCNFMFELWNYLPPPGAQNIGWSNPNGTYNSLYIYNNGVYLDSITNFSGGNYTTEVYYFNFNNLDTIDVIFNNYGSAANECMYRVYDSFGGLIATQGFPGSPPGNVNFVSVCDSSTLTPGCTDPYALNYDSLAVIDNGSCTYSGLSLDPVSDSLCLGDTVVITWSGGNPSDNILLRTINNTLWQTGFTIAIIPNTGSYTWVVSNFPAGPGDLYQFYIEDTPNQNSWDYGSVFAICPIYGCVDPLATNFDPQATLDNGSCLYPNYNNSLVIDSINAINPILCYGNLGDIEVFVDNDTSSFGTGTNLVTYQLKAFKVGSSSTFSYLSSSQTNASSVVASGFDQSTYYLLVVDSVAFNSTYNPFLQYFSNSYFINTVLNDPAVYDFDSIYLSEPAELVNSISTVSSNLCFGDCDASELITVSGGVMPYSLNGINLLQSDTLLSNLCAGNYSVNITDANGCQVSNLFSFITIVEPPLAQSFDSVFTCNTYLWNGSLLDSAGWYYDTLATSNSCDSIASLYLSIIPCYGCTDPNALNYDSTATVDDGSCTYLIYGCTDPVALNYDSLANIDDGSCLYCNYGCTDPNALNYDSLATCDDGSCIPLVYGCTDSLAINYFSGANTDDGSCIYAGCTDSTALNYDSTATIDDGSCYYGGCQEPAPINIYADAITDNKATINWANMNSNSCMVLKYVIRYRELGTNSWTTKSGGAGNGLCNFGLNNTSKTLLNLVPGTTYQYKIKAFYCFGGSSVWTLPKLFTTEDFCPPMANLSVQTFPANSNKATFSWDSTGAYVFARIALRENNSGASWQTAGGFGIYYPTLSVNKFGLQSGTDYRAQGRTFCDSNITSYRSWWTPLIFWTQPGTIRLNGSSNIKDLEVYPNPSRDKFNIVFRSDEIQKIEVRVLNILGKVVFEDNLFEFVGEYTRAVDLSDFEKTIYFLEIETLNGKINKKLVLQ